MQLSKGQKRRPQSLNTGLLLHELRHSVNSHLAQFATKLCFFVLGEKIAPRSATSPHFSVYTTNLLTNKMSFTGIGPSKLMHPAFNGRFRAISQSGLTGEVSLHPITALLHGEREL